MSKHTPGPWKIAAHCSTLIFDGNGRSIASAGGYQSNTSHTLDENEANTNLIAAAPDLLEALETIINSEWMVSHDWGGDRDAVMDKATAAINKARGK